MAAFVEGRCAQAFPSFGSDAPETHRCLCDNCYGVCPDNAITKLGPGKGFAIDLDYCKGCAVRGRMPERGDRDGAGGMRTRA